MQYKLITALTAALGATQAVAYSHGERGVSSSGEAVRWHQLARDVFTAVPEGEWDEKLHKRGNAEWDAEELALTRRAAKSSAKQDRSAELTTRNLPSFCQADETCTKVGNSHIIAGLDLWVELAAGAAANAQQDLFDFLAADFVASDVSGIAISGRVSGQIDLNTKIECSTDDSQADAISSVLNTSVARTPDASDVAVQVNGPSGSWIIKAAAGAKNTQVSSTC